MVAHVLGENNQYDEAIALWESILILSPDDEFSLKSLGYLYFSKKDFENALVNAKRFLEVANEDSVRRSSVHLLIAESLWALEEKTESREWANRFLEMKSHG